MDRGTSLALAVVTPLLAACASAGGELRCTPSLDAVPRVELFFGRSLPDGGEVSEAEWQSFVDAEVTPRFPAGLTVFDAQGQWQEDGRVKRENSKVLLILPLGIADREARLDAIMAAYRARFRQSSVLQIEEPGRFALRGG